MWSYLCPKCRKEVKQKTHKCIHCGEEYGKPIRVPPTVLKDKKALEEYVHKHIFPRVSEFERAYLTKYFTVIFENDFEDDFASWTGISGSPSVTDTDSHHGTKSATATGTAAAYCYKDIAAQTIGHLRAYVKITVPPSDAWKYDVILAVLNGNSWICRVDIIKSTVSHRWRFDYHDGATHASVDSSDVVVDTGKWYCLEIRTVIHASAGEYRLYVDDVEISTVTGKDSDEHGIINRVVAIKFTTTVTTSTTLFVECVVVADAYIGVEEEVPLAPEIRHFYRAMSKGGRERNRVTFGRNLKL